MELNSELESDELDTLNPDENLAVIAIEEDNFCLEGGVESRCSDVFYTPKGTRYYIPDVPLEYKPVKGSLWNSLDEALVMYENYAEKAGFTVRKSSQKWKDGVVSHRYFLCNKEGKPRNKKVVDTMNEESSYLEETCEEQTCEEQTTKKQVRKKRNSNFKVTDCKARIKLKHIKGTPHFVLYGFEERHNHELEDEENNHLSRSRRKLEFENQLYIHTVGMNNIGPTKAHRLRACLKGGYDQVHGTVVDYKNFKRDLNSYTGDRDALMLIDKFAKRKLSHPKFSFDYKTDNHELIALFWADETSRCNYIEFGDVLAFDATYRTNKYSMKFIPFTGVDHHNKCVTFGVGLLKSEITEAYTWLLQAFLKTHSKQPTLVLTDQDPAMKHAVNDVLKESKHRLCMWHIMKKLPFKVCGEVLKNTNLRKRIHKIMWDVWLTPAKFESRWTSLIEEFNLQDNDWLSDMFAIRERWVPGYFNDLPMCCLMKTTSRSKSSNAFFYIFADPSHTLVQFMICFESAMEKQRHTHQVLDHQTRTTTPAWLTPLKIEAHASSVYTLAIFLKVQKEIFRGVWFCSQKVVPSDDGTEVSQIIDVNQKTKVVSKHQVVQNEVNGSIVCSCNHFGHHGWLCLHIFCVLKSNQIDEIPERYINRRWRRDVLPPDLFDKRHRYGMKHNENTKLCNEANSDMELCVSRLRNYTQKLSSFVEKIKQLKSEVLADLPEQPAHKTKEQLFSELLDVTTPDEVLVHPPTNVKTEGSGSGKKRMVG